MDDSSGPSRPRRSSDPLLGSRDIAPGLRRFSQDPSSLPEDGSPPPKYTEAPAPMNGDALDGRTRQALLGGSSGDGPRKMSEDGLEPNREEMRLASLEQRKALWWRNTLVTAMFIASWYGFATLLSLYNKWMFSPQYYNFPYPLFVTTCHMIVQFFCAAMIRLFLAERFRPPERPTRQAYVKDHADGGLDGWGYRIVEPQSQDHHPQSLQWVSPLPTSDDADLHAAMCKSSTLIFVLLFAFLFHLEKYSLRLISVISLISFGVFLMVFNTTSVSLPGILMVFSASGLAGLRWALTELVMHKKWMGLSNPFATIFWLAPLMAITLAIVSIALEGWVAVLKSEHFAGTKAIMTVGVIILPGVLAFAMVASEYFIIKRAGSVPMSIAGIAKEVSTISISAWVFGDQLTELNIVGVVITVCGIALYTFHKYQKNISSPDPLDSSETAETANPAQPRFYAMANSEIQPLHLPGPAAERVPLASLNSSTALDRQRHAYPPEEGGEDGTNRLRDDFEGWNDREAVSEDDDSEVGEEEGERRRNERDGKDSGGKSWGTWWEKEM